MWDYVYIETLKLLGSCTVFHLKVTIWKHVTSKRNCIELKLFGSSVKQKRNNGLIHVLIRKSTSLVASKKRENTHKLLSKLFALTNLIFYFISQGNFSGINTSHGKMRNCVEIVEKKLWKRRNNFVLPAVSFWSKNLFSKGQNGILSNPLLSKSCTLFKKSFRCRYD